MTKIRYEVSRSKRRFILDWFKSLRTSKFINWPEHSMTSKAWFALFKRINPEHAHLFSDLKFFSTQVNSIITLGLFPNLSKTTKRKPVYKVIYTLQDFDYLDDVVSDLETLDKQYTSKNTP